MLRGRPTDAIVGPGDHIDPPLELRLAVEGDVIVITVHGVLDGGACRLVAKAATSAIETGCSMVQIDLNHIASFTREGAIAVTGLRQELPCADRLAFRAGSAVARAALLQGCAPRR